MSLMNTNQWKPITETEPPQSMAVLTKIDDQLGVRNEVVLKRKGRLWFFEDGSMYVYYTPTHYLQTTRAPQ